MKQTYPNIAAPGGRAAAKKDRLAPREAVFCDAPLLYWGNEKTAVNFI